MIYLKYILTRTKENFSKAFVFWVAFAATLLTMIAPTNEVRASFPFITMVIICSLLFGALTHNSTKDLFRIVEEDFQKYKDKK